MTFQQVHIAANALTPSMTLSRCDTCFALVMPSDQQMHEHFHQTVGNQGPPGPMGHSGMNGKDITEEQLEDLERRILRKMLGAQDE